MVLRICENPNCNKEYESFKSNSKFCSASCRYKVWELKHTTHKKEYNTVQDIKDALEINRAEFHKLQNAFSRLMEMYDDIETRAVILEKRLFDIESETTSEFEQLKIENEVLKKDYAALQEDTKDDTCAVNELLQILKNDECEITFVIK